MQLDKNAVGLTLGLLFALFHLIWVILVGLKVAKPLVDWLYSLHFFSMSYSLAPFNLGKAVLLVLLTFIVGYVVGLVFAALWDVVAK